ncbi:type II toxin-antitoxin system VapC family toxin [Floridanema evergladense]|uniref:Type II toxin-antitoxin system VapC family toxin n=1 Tax=Floridaenema evergladense BLCC-F167 TaxID=3153639 RepID=A0ABV4WIM9_9CYAN
MIYLLDTNICIHHLKFPNSIVTRRLRTLRPTDVAVSAVTKAELFFGAMRSNNPTQALRSQQEFWSQFVSLGFGDRRLGNRTIKHKNKNNWILLDELFQIRRKNDQGKFAA